MEKTINIFGDSIAWGAGDSEMGGWVSRLKLYLKKENKNYFEIYNLGISGDNTDGLLKRFGTENEARNPDIIIIAIGTNDACFLQSKSGNYVLLEQFEDNLGKIIELGKEYTDQMIFVGLTRPNEKILSPVPWATDFHCRNRDFEIYNNKVKETCEKNGLLFIEMLDLLEDADLEDGLHPNSAGHEKMFLRVKDFLEENKIV